MFEPKKDVDLAWATTHSLGRCAERKAGVWHDASWNDLPLDVWSVNELDGSISLGVAPWLTDFIFR
jgi:hypothetical protein